MLKVLNSRGVLSLLMLLAVTAQGAQGSSVLDRIAFDSTDEDFDEVFPLTENLNSVMAKISRMEVEAGRSIPNFVIFPYNPEDEENRPFLLIWDGSQYSRSNQAPSRAEVFVAYDPRRLASSTKVEEEGKRVAYRHILMTYRFNKMQPDGKPLELESWSSALDQSLYIGRKVLKSTGSGDEGVLTNQSIGFPRIAIPRHLNDDERVTSITFRFESAAVGTATSSDSAEDAGTGTDSIETVRMRVD